MAMTPNSGGSGDALRWQPVEGCPAPKKLRFSSQVDVTSANARDVTPNVRPRFRIAGRPMRVATTAPATPAISKPIERSQPEPSRDGPGDRGADPSERDLPEADVPGPPGQHDQRACR